MLVLRRPAPSDFLARRLQAIDWFGGRPPAEGSRRHLVEICRAELEWAHADWRRLGGVDEGLTTGPHPSEAWRLPHEQAAARLVNAHLHIDVASWRIGELLLRLRDQRSAATDMTQSEDYRLGWADAAAGCLGDLQMHLHRRRRALRVFLSEVSHYRRLRAAIDRTARAAA
jgi:hypothetical protein